MMQETKDERLQKLSNRISLEMKGPMETMEGEWVSMSVTVREWEPCGQGWS